MSTPLYSQLENADNLQDQYETDYADWKAAVAQQKADLAAYQTQLAADLSSHQSPDEILAVVMGLISGYGLSAQEDNVSVTTSELNMNSDLGAISNDMQNQLNGALTANSTGEGGFTGGMTTEQAQEMQKDYYNLQDDLVAQKYAATPGSPAYEAATTMLNALKDLDTQAGGFLDAGTPEQLAYEYNSIVAMYNQGEGGGQDSINGASPSGALSSSFSDLGTIKQTTGSTSTQLNAETQYQTQLIQTVETFINNGFQEIAQLNKTFATNQMTS